MRTRFVHAQQRTSCKRTLTKNVLRKPHITPIIKPTTRLHAIDANTVVEASYFAGKYILLFVFFYSGLNYLQFRKWRKMLEDEDIDKKK